MPLSARRRSFLHALLGTPLLPAALAEAQTAPSPSPVVPPSVPPSPAPPSPMAEALAEAARARFGSHLGPGDLDEIKKIIQGNLDAAERLRALKLGNADEPVTLFEPRPRAPRRAADARGPRPGVRPVRLRED